MGFEAYYWNNFLENGTPQSWNHVIEFRNFVTPRKDLTSSLTILDFSFVKFTFPQPWSNLFNQSAIIIIWQPWLFNCMKKYMTPESWSRWNPKKEKLAIFSISWKGFTGLSSMNPWTNDAGYKLIMYYAKDLTLVNSNIKSNLYMSWYHWKFQFENRALPCDPYPKFRMQSHLVPFRD